MRYTTKTRVLKIDSRQPDAAIIREAAAVVRAGGLVAFPTETVYGLGANALDANAISRIFSAKQRPAADPVIAHIVDRAQVDRLAINIPPSAYPLADTFWPGPLTLVLRRAPNVPANIAAGLDTIAVRMPAHPVARALIQAAGVPIAAPSANTFSRPSATAARHVLEDLDGHVDVVLDGGTTTIGLESTVLDLTGETPLILRPGGITLEALRRLLPDARLSPRFVDTDTAAASPGQMLKHYAPRARVIVYTGDINAVLATMRQTAQQRIDSGERVGVLIADEDAALFNSRVIVQKLGSRHDLTAIGQNLFAALRHLDAQGADVILTRDFGRDGLGAAVWDRLVRAAEGNIVQVDW